MVMIIGASNGWLYGEGINDVGEHKKIIEKAKGNAIEISLRENEKINSNLFEFPNSEWFSYRYAHLPEIDSKFMSNWIKFAKEFHKIWKCDYYTVHPSMITNKNDWMKLKKSELPIAIENMDKNKSSGFKISELKKIINGYGFGFVFDLQHAYSHDATMKYANDLFLEFKDKITHIHISGEKKGVDHVLVKDSDNKKEIINFLKEVMNEINVPIIIEGKYISSTDLKQEIDFIKDSLSH